MAVQVRANNKASKVFTKIMGTPAPLDEGYYKKKKKTQTNWYQTLPGSRSPNGIGPIF